MAALIVLGLLAGIVCLVFFIISIAKKRRKLWWVLGGCASFLVFIIGIIGTLANSPTSSTTSLSNSATTNAITSNTKNSLGIIISYSLKTATQIGSDYPSLPSSGDIFLIVSFNIENNGYSSFNTNPFYFSVITNNIKYNYSADSYLLDNQLKIVDILNGGTLKGDLAFEVPANSTDFQIQYNGLGGFNIQWVRQ